MQTEIESNSRRPWYDLRLAAALEDRFQVEQAQRSGAYLRSWLLVFVLFNILSLKLDFDAFGPEAFAVPAALTLGVFVPLTGMGILLLHGQPSPLRRTIVVTVVSLTDMLIVLNSARIVPAEHANVYIVLAVIVPLVVGLIADLSFRHSLVFCGTAFAAYGGWMVCIPPADVVGSGLPVLVACLILVPIKGSYSRERQEKRAFVLRHALEAANARLTVLSTTDALTGLANRRVFNDALAEAWNGVGGEPGWCAVVAIDIDHFKRLNDLAGHPEGDRCLVAVAAALDEPTRAAGGLLARYGGEEFMAFFPGATPEEALDLGERLRVAVEGLAFRCGRGGSAWVASVSIGVTAAHSVTGACGVGPGHLLTTADAALYSAKHRGRNRVEALPIRVETANGDSGPAYSAASS
ncbi:hypothetical protein ASF28_15585 [Methylobacterium sp. Leaf99]|jgi:diguanylate cyclase (GGDEF)-like protein|uniref:GGDEF domain-containing protein n=1 Tax=Methylobacterium sp. Leaf99 TaxID=1736251 RepID=UPI0006F434E6|nr:GGDEF domain-containing protein [Methylobacterium sp. Leaf99]KQP07396.1 hypothetical protein ASF28_15585 [Methylobacterium sp. Leaf99]